MRLIKNVARESENDMYSKLLILMTTFWHGENTRKKEVRRNFHNLKVKIIYIWNFDELTIMSRGKVNLQIRDATLKYPTKNCLHGEFKYLRLT